MTDDRQDHDDLADGEVLGAYLDGDTDDVTTARLERRLAGDPALAARLDDLAAARTRLQRLSEVRAPDDVRARLRERLAHERATGAVAPGTGQRAYRRWSSATAPRLAVAVVVLIAVLALGTAAVQLLGRSAADSGESAALGVATGAARAAAGAEADDAGGAEAGGDGSSEAAQDAAAPQVAPTVEADQQIVDRALRQPRRAPGALRARERRLRRRAGLPTDRLCVTELDGRTVDLVERDGRLQLAVLVDASGQQIVLVDPRTCAPERTIPADAPG